MKTGDLVLLGADIGGLEQFLLRCQSAAMSLRAAATTDTALDTQDIYTSAERVRAAANAIATFAVAIRDRVNGNRPAKETGE